MKTANNPRRYVLLLRGINVGGNRKVPMAELRETLEGMGFGRVKTFLNSGNVVFDAPSEDEVALEERIAVRLAAVFGFPIPVLIRDAKDIGRLIDTDPFRTVEIHSEIRLYITFLKSEPSAVPPVPWTSSDGSFRIVAIHGRAVCGVLDLSSGKTPEAMSSLERLFGKDITTRNWNTIQKIAGSL
jgi:uncharacterized protein (DUF1697 family)